MRLQNVVNFKEVLRSSYNMPGKLTSKLHYGSHDG